MKNRSSSSSSSFFLLFLLHFHNFPLPSEAQDCNPQCVHGECTKGSCVCELHFTGTDCSQSFREVLGTSWVVYTVLGLILSFLLVGVSLALGVITIVKRVSLEITQKVSIWILCFGGGGKMTDSKKREERKKMFLLFYRLVFSFLLGALLLQNFLYSLNLACHRLSLSIRFFFLWSIL